MLHEKRLLPSEFFSASPRSRPLSEAFAADAFEPVVRIDSPSGPCNLDGETF
jgi:hypothetical protein